MLDNQGVHYSTNLNSFETMLVGLFDKAIGSTQNVPQLEKVIIKYIFKLFWYINFEIKYTWHVHGVNFKFCDFFFSTYWRTYSGRVLLCWSRWEPMSLPWRNSENKSRRPSTRHWSQWKPTPESMRNIWNWWTLTSTNTSRKRLGLYWKHASHVATESS